ncbi:MAG TPA: YbhB/YbcL family Raf kinase inhibitor-like protein [Coriobacteriia bacterium]|jgi:hypothetical protein
MFELTSPAFGENQRIPDVYAAGKAGGENRSIPYTWSGAPSGTRSFVLAIVDHAPVASDWVHWVVLDIPKETTSLPDGASRTSAMPAGSRELDNTGGTHGYGGPAPPPGTGDHPYVATVYALSVPSIDMPKKPTAADIGRAVSGKVIGKATLTGVYSR